MRLGDRTLRMKFENANASAPFSGLGQSAHPTNSFRGKSYQRIENYTKLRRTGVYPGIDLLYYSRNGELEYDFELAPNADPSRISLTFEGADSVKINDRGDLILSLAGKDLTERAPSVYQRLASGEIVSVASSYVLSKDRKVTFRLGDYDRSKSLVIDPSIYYVAFLGGSYGDTGVSIGHDGSGNMYVGGYTYSNDFPINGLSYSITPYGEADCFIVKINPTASDPSQVIVYSTYYGGSSDEFLTDMKVSTTGLVYFTGNTDSTNFPISTGAFSNVLSTLTHAFIVELDTTQDSFYSQLYSTYFGGTLGNESGQGIYVANNFIYVTGYTTSADFPTSGAFQGVLGGGGNSGNYDAFVAKFDPSQVGPNSLIFSSFIGGGAQDVGNDIAVDGNGLIYITGYTFSADFVNTSATAFQSYAGEGDAFMTVINPGSSTVVYSTFFGGSLGFDQGTKILVDPTGTLVTIAGDTLSPNLPTTQNGYQPVMPAGSNIDANGNLLAGNGFLAIFNMTQTKGFFQGLTYSTYFGGFGGEVIFDLKEDSQGYYYFCGYTLSANLPVTPGALNTTSAGGGEDGYVAVLNPSAKTQSAQLVYGSYVTSPGTQIVYGIDVDPQSRVWITGTTTADIFPAGYETFPVSPTTLLPQPGKQESFIWGFTIGSGSAQASDRSISAERKP